MLAKSLLDTSTPLSLVHVRYDGRTAPAQTNSTGSSSHGDRAAASNGSSATNLGGAPAVDALGGLSDDRRFSMLSKHVLLIKRQSIVLGQSAR